MQSSRVNIPSLNSTTFLTSNILVAPLSRISRYVWNCFFVIIVFCFNNILSKKGSGGLTPEPFLMAVSPAYIDLLSREMMSLLRLLVKANGPISLQPYEFSIFRVIPLTKLDEPPHLWRNVAFHPIGSLFTQQF